MKKTNLTVLLLSVLLITACNSQPAPRQSIELHNPVIPGYFADPSIVQHEGKFYMYVTADPWGGDFLACWESEDFREWTFNKLNWPTKQACISPTSNENMVWAPSVIKKGNNFYMYISVGSEIWCGIAQHPLGPWKNMLDDRPMIPFDKTEYYHVIDAEAFIDDDGKAYLYWGSGWNWINGHCFAAELNNDMSSFKSEPVEVTPPHYFEGPLMIKHNSTYYLTYSEGKTIDDTYEVRYATGDTPFGPFTEAENSPILKTDKSLDVYGPGHHTVLNYDGKNYIVYHRHRLPFISGTAYRQVCINELEFDDVSGQIKNITPVHTQAFPDLRKNSDKYIRPESVTASSEKSDHAIAQYALDNNFATLWEPTESDDTIWIATEFKPDTYVKQMKLRLEYPWETYYFKVETAQQEDAWETVADYTEKGATGSPVNVPVERNVRYIRVLFNTDQNATPAVWELYFQ